MSMNYVPILEVFLGILGFSLSLMFCTSFCRMCCRLREDLHSEALRQSDEARQQSPIYFIPFVRSMTQRDGEDVRVPPHSQEHHSPPRYSTAAYCGPPPSYDELGFKPDDLPPAYTEYNLPVHPTTPPPHTDMVQSQTWPQS